MTGAIETTAAWLLDYYLLTLALLVATLTVLFVVKQPAQRLAIIKASLVALLLLADTNILVSANGRLLACIATNLSRRIEGTYRLNVLSDIQAGTRFGVSRRRR